MKNEKYILCHYLYISLLCHNFYISLRCHYFYYISHLLLFPTRPPPGDSPPAPGHVVAHPLGPRGEERQERLASSRHSEERVQHSTGLPLVTGD